MGGSQNRASGVQNMSIGGALSVVILAVLFKFDPTWAFNAEQTMAFGIVCGAIWHGFVCMLDRILPRRNRADQDATPIASTTGGAEPVRQ